MDARLPWILDCPSRSKLVRHSNAANTTRVVILQINREGRSDLEKIATLDAIIMQDEKEEEEERIKSLLAPYSNDLWIERRLNLGEILASLNECRQTGPLGRDWHQFIEFLAEHCSGRHFSRDKQWGELLNHMMISRKLNHKSVKFRDIMANKQQIESNAQLIRAFNGAAQLGEAIETNSDSLEQSLASTRLFLSVAEGDAADAAITLDGLSEAKSHLNDKCRPLAYSLRVSLEDERIQKDHRLEVWRARETNFAANIKRISDFVSSLGSLQTKLHKIKYIDATIGDGRANSSSNHLKSKVRLSIEICRREMREVQEFYLGTMRLLRQIAARTNSRSPADNSKQSAVLLLVKVFQPKEYISPDDIRLAVEKADGCQRKLDEIMQNLRREFGRFYFLNDLELLTVVMIDTRLLFDSPDNNRMILKLFNNSVCSFKLDERQQRLVGVKSPSREVVMFAEDDFVALKKPVQVYSLEVVRILNEVQRKLRKSLKSMLLDSLDRDQGIVQTLDWSLPVQLIDLKESVKFCSRVERVLQSDCKELSPLIELYEQQSRKLSELKNDDKQTSASKISAAISMSVQFISLLMSMRHHKVEQANDWLWQKQIRYYVMGERSKTERQLEVRIADARFTYKFDFLSVEWENPGGGGGGGGFKRLISTKITERCLLLASQAVCHLRLGANPFGPAGGGKTETIKALGRLLGQQVIVHNCDETNDIESLDRLIWGLAHTGLWGCFDEFNRLSASTMSVISATLELVQSSIRENKTTVGQNDNLMCIDQDSAFFITLNPAGIVAATSGPSSKYKGRRKLPANLRNLFLPISMVRVQIDSIVRENLLRLSVEQTIESNTGARNIIELGTNLQLFMQQMKEINLGAERCEWDLRLVMSALYRLKIYCLESQGKALSRLMVNSLCAEVEPRLTSAEFVQFHESLREFSLLNGTTRSEQRHPDDQKVDQLRGQLKTRSGVLLVGGPQSGKSSAWRRLMSEDQQDGSKWIAVNPRSCSQQELFGGFFEKQTTNSRKKWRDGLFTVKVREALDVLQGEPDLRQVCIILDGPIDPDWIESLNSVLDDNRVLTLGSGERLNFCLPTNQSIKLLFETDSIERASPATISRLGLVYFDRATMEAGNLYKEVFVDRVQDLGAHLPNGELTIICAQNLDHRAINEYLLQHCPAEVGEYSCSQSTDSSHFVDLLSRLPTKQTYIIHNISLIRAQDQWRTRTFIESLRFSIDYGGFYDEQFKFKSMDKVRFVLICKNLNQIDTRLARKASLVVHLKPTSLEEEIQTGSVEDILQQNAAILVVKNDIHLPTQEIIRRLQADGRKVCTFENSTKSKESIDSLEKQVISCFNGGSELVLYVLLDLQFHMMRDQMKAKLMHLLNFLEPSRMKFLLVCHSSEISPAEQLGLMVKVIALKNDTESLQSSIERKLKEGQIPNWVQERILSEITDGIDEEKIVSLIEAFMDLYQRSSTDLMLRRKALRNGLENLREFDIKVEQMRKECKLQGLALRDKNTQIDQTLATINLSLAKSEQRRGQLDELRMELESKRLNMMEKSKQLEAELSKVSPMLEASKAEVIQHLKAEALNEIKTLRAPPKTIKDILDALFILLGAKDLTWSTMKSHLASKSLKEELANYQFERRINREIISSVQTLISQREESFQADQARRASKAVVPLLSWIRSALEYGKVLLKSSPLRAELQQLKADLEKLDEFVRKAAADLKEINQNIELEQRKLADLREESEKLQLESEGIQLQLQKSKQLRMNLDGQTTRWDQDLHMIDSLLEPEDRLAKLCYMTINMAFHYTAEAGQSANLEACLEKFELVDETRDTHTWIDFICRGAFSMILDIDNGVGESMLALAEEAKIVELAILRLFIEFVEHPWFPFLTLDRIQEEAEVVGSVIYGNILGLSPRDILFVRFQSDIDHLRQIVSTNLNRLICLDVRQMEEESHLDLIDSLFNQKSCKFILLGFESGNFERTFARYLVKFPQILAAQAEKNIEQVQEIILDSIMEAKEPILMKELQLKEAEWQTKQKSLKSNEVNLLSQLVTSSSSSSSASGSKNFSDVVRVLGCLQQLNEDLANDRKLLEELRQAVNSKRQAHQESSLECAKFYTNILEPLGGGFSGFSLKKYTQLLLCKPDVKACETSPNSSSSGGGGDDEFKTNKKLIVRHAMLTMEPKRRCEFVRSLLAVGYSANLDDVFAVNTTAKREVSLASYEFPRLEPSAKTQLGKIILNDVLSAANTMNTKLAGRRERRKVRCQLIVVLHNPSKSSSPQRELDYLFGCLQSDAAAGPLTYDKIYATGDRLGQAKLEAKLRKFTSLQMPESTRRCLCVVNAHLAKDWLNSNLLNVLEEEEEKDKNNGTTTNDNLRVLILIGETVSPTLASPEALFDFRLLDYAQVRYWHDELAHSLVDRFDTCLGSESIRKDVLSSQLILFHVVCQERAKLSLWLHPYNFDCDLLNLALRTLERLALTSTSPVDEDDLRARLSNYLNDIVYGVRMETEEDDRVLAELIGRFLGNTGSAQEQLNLLGELRSAIREQQQVDGSSSCHLADQLLAKLIGSVRQ